MPRAALGGGAPVKGIKELAAQLKAIGDVVMGQEALKVLGDAANSFRAKALANAKRARWPHEVFEDSFVDARPTEGFVGRRLKKISALFGFAKRGRNKPYRHGYVEWKAKDKGRTVGMSLATLFEFGGSKLSARPAFRPALKEARPEALNVIELGLKRILDEAARRTS